MDSIMVSSALNYIDRNSFLHKMRTDLVSLALKILSLAYLIFELSNVHNEWLSIRAKSNN